MHLRKLRVRPAEREVPPVEREPVRQEPLALVLPQPVG
jgi:hypothetical protein